MFCCPEYQLELVGNQDSGVDADSIDPYAYSQCELCKYRYITVDCVVHLIADENH